ncbi:MAG TPA: hypothetical protein PKY82_26435, partial [Pyrinomonadaceae bacterium]|nr:hypothetical protein [Pyrinomonadaceae bacterium]
MFDVNSVPITVELKVGETSYHSSSEPSLIKLTGGFSTLETRYKLEISSNGTGTIIYSDDDCESEEFVHETDLKSLVNEIEEAVNTEVIERSVSGKIENSEIENIRKEITAEKLEDFFWNEINQTLEDPFFRSFDDESEWGAEFYCENGDTNEFEEFLELCV